MSGSAFSKAGLGAMHDVLAGHVTRGDVPGLVSLVSRRGEVHVDAIGTKTIGGNDPIRRDTIFRISSMTKPITAAATMILVEDGRIRLDEPVDRLLPELANRSVLNRLDGALDDVVPSERPITVRDLLTFTMGFGVLMAPPGAYPIQKAIDELSLGQGPPQPAMTPAPDEWIQRLGSLPLMFQAGERWMYNTGADVLGVLIARASGRPFEAFLQERLFGPLGMKDTAFHVPASKIDRLPIEYGSNFSTGATEVSDAAGGGQWSCPPAFPSGRAGLVSTVDDYLAFGRMLLDRGNVGGTRILSAPSVEAMTTDQLTREQKAVSGLTPGFFAHQGWGFGMSVVTKQDDVSIIPGGYGWDGGLGTVWHSDPNEELVTILMTQRMWTSPDPPKVCRDFWTAAYAAIRD